MEVTVMKTPIDLAKEARIYGPFLGEDEDLERFAALVENKLKTRLADAIEQMPFGDTAASFAQFVREFK